MRPESIKLDRSPCTASARRYHRELRLGDHQLERAGRRRRLRWRASRRRSNATSCCAWASTWASWLLAGLAARSRSPGSRRPVPRAPRRQARPRRPSLTPWPGHVRSGDAAASARRALARRSAHQQRGRASPAPTSSWSPTAWAVRPPERWARRPRRTSSVPRRDPPGRRARIPAHPRGPGGAPPARGRCRRRPDRAGMATTLTAVLARGDRYAAAHRRLPGLPAA